MSETKPTQERRGILATIVIVVVVGFILLAGALRIEPAYAGLLFFWYWAAIQDAKPKAMPSSLLGALLGVGTAALLQAAVRSQQPVAIVAVLILIVVAIAADVMRLLPFAINACFMLFLTIASAPLIQGHEDFVVVVESILLSALYFGAIVLLMSWLQARSARRRQGAG